MPEQRKYSILKHLFGLVAIIFTLPCLGQPVDTARIPLELPGTQKMEIADFNFDGYTDYRIGTVKYTTKFDYYLYSKAKNKFEKDTFLSSLDGATFQVDKKIFTGYKQSRVNSLTTQTDVYGYANGGFVLIQRTICTSRNEHAERMDCAFYEIKNGQLVFKQLVKGPE